MGDIEGRKVGAFDGDWVVGNFVGAVEGVNVGDLDGDWEVGSIVGVIEGTSVQTHSGQLGAELGA